MGIHMHRADVRGGDGGGQYISTSMSIIPPATWPAVLSPNLVVAFLLGLVEFPCTQHLSGITRLGHTLTNLSICEEF